MSMMLGEQENKQMCQKLKAWLDNTYLLKNNELHMQGEFELLSMCQSTGLQNMVCLQPRLKEKNTFPIEMLDLSHNKKSCH